MKTVGVILAVLSAIFNGSFSVPSKLKLVVEAQASPFIYSLWTCCGVALSGLLVWPVVGKVFDVYGLISGALFVVSTASAFAAVRSLNIAVANGIWSGVAVLVSFGFGHVILQEHLESPLMGASAIVLLVMGIISIMYSLYRSERHLSTSSSYHSLLPGGIEESLTSSLCAPSELVDDTVAFSVQPPLIVQDPLPRRRTGLRLSTSIAWKHAWGGACAVSTGVFGGLILAPMQLADPSIRGLPFIPSLAVGVLLSTPIIMLIIGALEWVHSGGHESTVFAAKLDRGAMYGLASGVIWAAGLVCCAESFNRLGMAVAYPIMQCGVVVAGLWGVLVFREPRHAGSLSFWVGCVAMIFGAGMLAFAKEGK